MQNLIKTKTRLAYIQFIFSTFFSKDEIIDETVHFQNYFYKLSIPSTEKDQETILDFKTGNKPRRDEWNDEYYLQLGAYSLAHDKVYGTNIKQGVILLCTKDLMFQRFIVDSERLKDCQQRFLEKVEQYYSMKLNS